MTEIEKLISEIESGIRGPGIEIRFARAIGADADIVGKIGPRMRRVPWAPYDTSAWQSIPRWCSDMDACLSLFYLLFPGWDLVIEIGKERVGTCHIKRPITATGGPTTSIAPTPACAIMAAILRTRLEETHVD